MPRASELAIPEIYKKVPVLAAIKLINQTLLPTVYEWGDVSSIYLSLFFRKTSQALTFGTLVCLKLI